MIDAVNTLPEPPLELIAKLRAIGAVELRFSDGGVLTGIVFKPLTEVLAQPPAHPAPKSEPETPKTARQRLFDMMVLDPE